MRHQTPIPADSEYGKKGDPVMKKITKQGALAEVRHFLAQMEAFGSKPSDDDRIRSEAWNDLLSGIAEIDRLPGPELRVGPLVTWAVRSRTSEPYTVKDTA